jgi:hypothetical protein
VRKAEEKEKTLHSRRAAKAARSRALKQLKQERAEAAERRRNQFKFNPIDEKDEDGNQMDKQVDKPNKRQRTAERLAKVRTAEERVCLFLRV